jgi:hypothetical protein
MRPESGELIGVLRLVARLTGDHEPDYCFEGRFKFALNRDWSLVVSPDDAERLKLVACFQSRPIATMWCLARNHERLSALVEGARDEALTIA